MSTLSLGEENPDSKNAVEAIDAELASLEALIRLQQKQHSLLTQIRSQLLNGSRRVPATSRVDMYESEFGLSNSLHAPVEGCETIFNERYKLSMSFTHKPLFSEVVTFKHDSKGRRAAKRSEKLSSKSVTESNAYFLIFAHASGAIELKTTSGNHILNIETGNSPILALGYSMTSFKSIISTAAVDGTITVHRLQIHSFSPQINVGSSSSRDKFEPSGLMQLPKVGTVKIQINDSMAISIPQSSNYDLSQFTDSAHCATDIDKELSFLAKRKNKFDLVSYFHGVHNEVIVIPDFINDPETLLFMNTSNIVLARKSLGNGYPISVIKHQGAYIAIAAGSEIHFFSAWHLEPVKRKDENPCKCNVARANSFNTVTALAFEPSTHNILYTGLSDGTFLVLGVRPREAASGKKCCRILHTFPPQNLIEDDKSSIHRIAPTTGYVLVSEGSSLSIYNTTNFVQQGVRFVCSRSLSSNDTVVSAATAQSSDFVSVLLSSSEGTEIYNAYLPYLPPEPINFGWIRWPFIIISFLAVFIYQMWCKPKKRKDRRDSSRNILKEDETAADKYRNVQQSLKGMEKRLESLGSKMGSSTRGKF